VRGRKYTRTLGKNHRRLSQREGSGADDPSTTRYSIPDCPYALLDNFASRLRGRNESTQFVFILDCPCSHRGASN